MSQLGPQKENKEPVPHMLDVLTSLGKAIKDKADLIAKAKKRELTKDEDEQLESLTWKVIAQFKAMRSIDRKLKIVPQSDEEANNMLTHFFKKFPNPFEAAGESFSRGQMKVIQEMQNMEQ